MRRLLLTGLAVLSLSGCGKDNQTTSSADESSGPQIATSIDDEVLALDRSDQISAIDAATGDARGMPRDGGGVVRMPQPEAKAAEASPENIAAPIVAPPPPPAAPIPASAPAPANP